MARAVIVLTFCYSSFSPFSIISTKDFKWGRTAHPINMAICYTILIPVCRAYQLFLDWQTAFKNGNNEFIPNAEATTAKARAVVFLTYSSKWSISGLIMLIILARPVLSLNSKLSLAPPLEHNSPHQSIKAQLSPKFYACKDAPGHPVYIVFY